MMDPVILQLLAPLVLVPVLIWIGARYLPVLQGAGRGRIYLLILLCGLAIGVQVGMVQTQAYPLVTWTMYGRADIEPTTYRFLAYSEEGVERFRWERVASTRSVIAFERNLTTLLRTAQMANGEEEAKADLARAGELLTLLAERHNEYGRWAPIDSVQVEQCQLDIHRSDWFDAPDCERVMTVWPDRGWQVYGPVPGGDA
jgi:hypothetical protein